MNANLIIFNLKKLNSYKLLNLKMLYFLFLLLLLPVCNAEESKITHPNFIQFELTKLNNSFSILLPRNLDEREKSFNSVANEITMASGNAAMKNPSVYLLYALRGSKTLEKKYYVVEKIKTKEKEYCIIITVNSNSDGFELYEKLLFLFNILEELKTSFDLDKVSYDENFKKMIYKACFRTERNMLKHYSNQGVSLLEKVKKIEKAEELSKRIELGYEKWVAAYGASFDELAFELWQQFFEPEE